MLSTSLLSGPRIQLGAFVDEDIPSLMQWRLDEFYHRSLDALPLRPLSKGEVLKWLEGAKSDTSFRFAIRDKETDIVIGFAEIDGILWTHRKGWISIGIGEEQYRGKGFGKETMECLLRFAFSELNLHRLQLTVFSYNHSAIALYKKLGFKEEGCYREFLERDNKRHDMLLFGILKTEWLDVNSNSLI